MKRHISTKLCLLTALLSGSSAHAAPAKWCTGTTTREHYSITDMGHFQYNSDADDLKDMDGFADVVLALCSNDPAATQYHAELEAARLRWTKRLHLTDADWADAFPFASSNISFRRSLHLDGAPGSGPIAQYDWFRRATLEEAIRRADTEGEHLSQAARLGYVAQCLEGEQVDPVAAALCVGDMGLDLDALGNELRASPSVDPVSRMTLRLLAEQVVRKLWPERKNEIAGYMLKDAGWNQIFKIAKAARQEWIDRKVELAPMRSLHYQLAHSKSPAGCDQTLSILQQKITAISADDYARTFGKSPSSREVLSRVMNEPAGYLAATNYAQCHPGTSLAVEIGAVGGPGLGGPRATALSRLILANPKPFGGDLRLPDLASDHVYRGGNDLKSSFGVLTGVTRTGDNVHLTFRKEPYDFAYCAESHQTDRVVTVMESGTVVYESVCTKTARAKGKDAIPPVDVAARNMTLRPGMVVVVEGDMVVVAWSKPDAKAPSFILGEPVK